MITYDRPGYGRSTRHPGRRVVDAANDVATIAEALGLTRFAVYGGSGGAPHALACAALLPDRVTRCASVVGPAPFGRGGLSKEGWFAGMVEGNVREAGWALAGEDTLRPELEREAREMLANFDTGVENPLGQDYELSSQDLEVMGASPPERLASSAFDCRGPGAVVVPSGHGEWLARTIPGAEAVRLEGGHFAIYDKLSDLLAWLTEDSERC